MATLLELCFKLGYHDPVDGVPSRGQPKVLLDDLKTFNDTHPWLSQPDYMTDIYLSTPPAGLKHTPVNGDANSVHLLLWARDRSRIKDLMTQLFTLLTQHRAKQSDVVDLEEPETNDANEVAFQRSVTMVPNSPIRTGQNDEVHTVASRAQSHAIGPITRLALRDGTIVSNLLKAGFTEPFPVIAPSEEKLIEIIEKWIEDHHGDNPPGSKPFANTRIGLSREFSTPITFSTTSEEVCAELYRVTNSRIAWILKDSNDSCMLVVSANGNNAQWRGYHGWLGGDLGFTAQTVANSDKFRQQKRGFDSNLSEDSGRYDAQGAATAKIKHESRPFEARQTALRQINAERDLLRLRLEGSPPLSSLDSIKKRRWPPQYVSPSPTSQAKKRCTQGTKKTQSSHLPQPQPPNRRHTRAAEKSPLIFPVPLSPDSLLERSSSPEILSVGLASSPGPRRSGRLGRRVSYVESKVPNPTRKAKSTKAKHQPTPVSLITPANQPVLSPPTTADVVFYFFLSNEVLGAVPVPFARCNTSAQFFEQALSAWTLLDGEEDGDLVAAISVVMEGCQWPVVVPWRSEQAYKCMVETITQARAGGNGNLEVKVKCIRK